MTTHNICAALDRYSVATVDKIVEKVYAPSNFANGSLIPTNADGVEIPISVDQVDVISAIAQGETSPQNLDSRDIPEMTISIGKDTYKTWHLPVSTSYSFMQLEAIKDFTAAGSPIGADLLIDGPMRSGIENITRVANRLAFYGTSTVSGLVTDPSVTPDNSSVNLYSATGQELVDFIVAEYHQVLVANNVEDDFGYTPNCIILPRALGARLAAQDQNFNGLTRLQRIMNACPGVSIHFTGLASGVNLEKYGVHAAGTNKDVMLIYPKADWAVGRKVSRVLPIPTSYTKGVYWSGVIQTVSQTFWKQPDYARIVKFANQ
jgi:hypothetical protein